jgi:hypothetical protein
MSANKQSKPDGDDGVPAFFLGALLTSDIPPYLTDGSGATTVFTHDPLATKLAKSLNKVPKKTKTKQ